MIKSHLGRLLGERKIRVADVSRDSGLSRRAITALYKETGARVEFETLDKLCHALGCAIGDLLEYVPGDPHPITVPRRSSARAKQKSGIKVQRRKR
jgi:putative transcriptional regulator